ncbi:MAG: sugar phosphate isomerase/epimerase [Oscillospiraceae bacterium]|nr:sugar phosphate isomerase/epimerase [Oscillospiraceae bacterium]
MILSMENCVLRNRFGDVAGLKMIRNAGFDGVDYSFYWMDGDSSVLGDGYREYAEKIRRELNELGLVCHQAHAPFDLRYGEALDESEPHYRDIVRSLEAASILGAKHIVVHSLAVPEGVDPEAYNIGFYKTLEPYCAKFGIQIAVENLFEEKDSATGFFKGRLASPEALCRVVNALGSEHFVACVDVGHSAITGTAPENFIHGMEPGLLKCLHIQDTDFTDDIHTLPYLGKLNWDAILAALKAYGYDGEMNFEVFGFQIPLPKEALPAALSFAAAVGRQMISALENA